MELDVVNTYVIKDDMLQLIIDEAAAYPTTGASSLPPLLVVVQVPEIASGAAWWSVYQNPFMDEPRNGAVGEVVASAALSQIFAHIGELPAPSKGDIEARFSNTDHGIGSKEHVDINDDALN